MMAGSDAETNKTHKDKDKERQECRQLSKKSGDVQKNPCRLQEGSAYNRLRQTHLPASLPTFLPACLRACLPACMPARLPARLPACLLACPHACLSSYDPTNPPTCPAGEGRAGGWLSGRWMH